MLVVPHLSPHACAHQIARAVNQKTEGNEEFGVGVIFVAAMADVIHMNCRGLCKHCRPFDSLLLSQGYRRHDDNPGAQPLKLPDRGLIRNTDFRIAVSIIE